ncbi:MAG: hypothetical protein E7508_07405 [Ruminococcus sp.]|nr:hypothetical protein [Ruminococcus sp.]
MNFKKYVAIAGAVSMIASAMSFTVNADETEKIALEYTVTDGKAIITKVDTSSVEFTEVEIPAKIEDGENVYEVVGVADYAFALCEDIEVICVPDSVTMANTGNVAFLTTTAIEKFLDNELSDAATVDDVVRYVAEKANYKNGDFTDEDLADVAVKLENKLNMVDISTANTVMGKVITLLTNVDQMNLNPDLQNSFDIWVSSITYNGLTLCASEASEMKAYAENRAFLNMNFEVHESYVRGDANGDGKLTVSDAAYIARTLAKGEKIEYDENPAADFNQDGKINVSDAANIARTLASAKG